MGAFVIIDVSIHDDSMYEEYKKLTPGSLVEYGGQFVVRGGKSEMLEGDWNPKRIVVIEFPSVEQAKAWWNSELYSKAKAIRQSASTTKMIVVPGV